MSFLESVSLKNILGAIINPGTEEKQDDQIAVVESISEQQIDGTQITGLVDAAQASVNPSSEEKQDSVISQQIDGTQRTRLVDSTGVLITDSNPVPIHDIDIHSYLVNEHSKLLSGITDTLSVAAASGDNVINVTNGGLFSVNNRITMEEGSTQETASAVILAISTNALTLDRPLESAYTTAAVIEIVDINLSNANGTLAVPVIYEIAPPVGVIWHINRLLLTALDGAAMDDGKFGGIPALTNGLVIRVKNSIIENVTVWRSNGDIAEDVYDLSYADKAPAGQYGMRARWSFSKMKMAFKLDGSDGDKIQIIIQDDLTGLDELEIKFQGHQVGI